MFEAVTGDTGVVVSPVDNGTVCVYVGSVSVWLSGLGGKPYDDRVYVSPYGGEVNEPVTGPTWVLVVPFGAE